MPTKTAGNITDHRALIILLRVVGISACAAIIASVMPTTWIVAIHKWLGLGDFPDAPITQYLARSISALYAIFGGLTIVVATDVQRYVPIIRYLAFVTLAFGVLIIGIDSIASMPTYWTLFEGPPLIILGVVILVLARRVERPGGNPGPA